MIDDRTSTFCGTLEYMAPEIFAGFSYSYPVDYWSFGILIFEMIYSMRPFQGTSEDQLRRMITEDPVIFPRQITGTDVPPSIKDLISLLLSKSQEDRLQTFDAFMTHDAFVNFDWTALSEKRIWARLIPNNDSPTVNFDPAFSTFPAALEHVTDRINPNIASAFEKFDEVMEEVEPVYFSFYNQTTS